ncbi:hypothetical protein MAR_032700 [Mya arenaria]|uniref:Uncharacterized protein n=1 Tax=Mya arenaria TaxID=6604 RepID=A0ABY7FAX5_MYAAR|nr:hypothetical protein MAR_032700 [Mya arenaria]
MDSYLPRDERPGLKWAAGARRLHSLGCEQWLGTQMLGLSHKRRRCWDPVTRGGGRDTDAETQSQEEEVGTQMLGPSHKGRRSGHRNWDPVTRGDRDTDAGTQ